MSDILYTLKFNAAFTDLHVNDVSEAGINLF